MKIPGRLQFSFNGERHIFRTLAPHDVDMPYVLALRNEISFIDNRTNDITIEYQQKYVNDILDSEVDTICGLFAGSKLIGTSGIQNLSYDNSKNRKMMMAVGSTSNCTLGVFVLTDLTRGKGYGKTLVWSSCYLSYCQFGITLFEASVLRKNVASLKTFLACGFKISEENEVGINLVLKVNAELLKPESVKRPVIIDENNYPITIYNERA